MEIQERILSFTELVSTQDLELSMQDKTKIGTICCKKCSDTLEACCCRFNFGSWSSTCICLSRSMQTFEASFNINRSWRSNALRVFYSQNHFNIVSHQPYPVYGHVQEVPTSGYGDLKLFLTRIPAGTAMHLRSLQLTMPSINDQETLPSDDDLELWKSSIELLSRMANLAKLNLTLDMSQDRKYLKSCAVPLKKARAIWSIYQRIVAPLACLGGLRNLFIRLSYPQICQPHRLRALQLRDQREQKLERSIMGADYDAFVHGKSTNGGFGWDGMYWEDRPMFRDTARGAYGRAPAFGPDGSQVWPEMLYEEPYFSGEESDLSEEDDNDEPGSRVIVDEDEGVYPFFPEGGLGWFEHAAALGWIEGNEQQVLQWNEQ